MRDPIVTEELALLDAVRRALEAHVESAGPSERTALRELERLREQLLSGRGADDRAAALLEYNRRQPSWLSADAN